MELKRDIYEELIQWKRKNDGKVLELSGARQVGKTYILDKFAKENYKKYVYINMMQTSGREFLQCLHIATDWKPGEKRIPKPLHRAFQFLNRNFRIQRIPLLLLMKFRNLRKFIHLYGSSPENLSVILWLQEVI